MLTFTRPGTNQRSLFSATALPGHEGAAAEGGDQGHRSFFGWSPSEKSRKFGWFGASNSTKIDDLMLYVMIYPTIYQIIFHVFAYVFNPT